MPQGKSIAITAYGHEKTLDKIAVSLFDELGNYGDENAKKYCDTINSLELKGDSWVIAKVVPENNQFTLDTFLPITFDLILQLDDRSLQKVLRDVEAQDLARALKGENEAIQEKVFRNMSMRASSMLKEDMEFMGPMRLIDVVEAQRRILSIIHYLESTGEIVINRPGETMV